MNNLINKTASALFFVAVGWTIAVLTPKVTYKAHKAVDTFRKTHKDKIDDVKGTVSSTVETVKETVNKAIHPESKSTNTAIEKVHTPEVIKP